MNLKDFITESKAFKLQPGEVKDAVLIVESYIKKYSKMNDEEMYLHTHPLTEKMYPSLYSIDSNAKPRYLHLRDMEVFDRETNSNITVSVFLITNYPHATAEGSYMPGEVFLFHDIIKNLSKQFIITALIHEIVHSVQYYKDPSEKYANTLGKDISTSSEDKYHYYSEPLEREATISSIVNHCERDFNRYVEYAEKYILKGDLKAAKYFISKINEQIKSVEYFLRLPLEQYFYLQDVLILPILQRYADFFQSIGENKTLKKEYKLKFSSLLYEMKTCLEKINKLM
jgi:hypothetical protein